MKILFVLILLSIILISGCDEKPTACTEEAKLCPDGSAVGRTGPDCEFAPCPETEEQEPEETKAECSINTDCVPAACCHAKECVPRSQAPNCKGMMCTMECAPGTIDCGGSCQCINNECKAVIMG